jgi:predicted hotdog family 3-hydroxylacyl-ACP dehydratase
MTERLPDVARLLPQQPPMRLLERVLACSAQGITAELHIGPDSPFRQAQPPVSGQMEPHPPGVPAWVGLEYLAQAAAAWFTLSSGEPAAGPRAGMLVACRRYEAIDPSFPDGSTLTVRAWPASAPGGSLVKFGGEIRTGARVIATGEWSVYLQTEDS